MAKVKTPTSAINSKSGRKSVAKIQAMQKQREKELEAAKKEDEQIEIQQIEINEIVEPETTVEPETMEYAAPMDEPKPSTPMDDKTAVLAEFVCLYRSNCIGKTIVPIEIGERINDCFNRYTGRKTTFNGCSACLAKQKKYLLNEAKNNGFVI